MIVDLLEMLASEERQRDYEARVPYVDITAELQCMWFDDFYVPDDLFFRSCFSKREFNAVREFNAFYRRKSRELPPSQGTIETWLASPVWRDIMAEAKSTLNKLELG